MSQSSFPDGGTSTINFASWNVYIRVHIEHWKIAVSKIYACMIYVSTYLFLNNHVSTAPELYFNMKLGRFCHLELRLPGCVCYLISSQRQSNMKAFETGGRPSNIYFFLNKESRNEIQTTKFAMITWRYHFVLQVYHSPFDPLRPMEANRHFYHCLTDN